MALLSGATVTEAAVAAGVQRTTVSAWLNSDAVFVAELRARRAELWDALRCRLVDRAAGAVDAVAELLGHEDWRARVAAARLLLAGLEVAEVHDRPSRERPEDVAGEWRRDEELRSILS
ncbi:MAG: hypothetical protein HY722_06330 [Planctomycetes bacterium]|nr:hypothetical protein [Planctomycetota bacterium]